MNRRHGTARAIWLMVPVLKNALNDSNLDGTSRSHFLFESIFEQTKTTNTMITQKTPTWWTSENDSAWDRVKAAFKRDWDQTQRDMGAKKPETNQSAKHTLKQAAGKEAIPPEGAYVFDNLEPAYRFGYGARSHFGDQYEEWDKEVEGTLRREWLETYPDRDWDEDVEYVRYGWDYEE
jgi:hypothetical protein